MRHLLVTILSASAVFALSGFAFPISQCNIPITSGDQPLLDKVYSTTASWNSNVHQDICPVHFSVDKTSKFECPDPFHKNTMDAAVATMDFRDAKGELYSVSYKACVPKGSGDPVIDENYIEVHHVAEVNFSYQIFPEQRRDSGNKDNNDDNCDTSRPVHQEVCAPSPYKVFAWSLPEQVDRSRDSSFINVMPSPTKPSCVVVSFDLKGGGYTHYPAGVKDCSGGSAWYKYTINLKAVSSGALK